MLFVLNTGRSGSRSIANVLSQHPELVCLHEPLPRLIEETVSYRYGELPGEDLGEILKESRPAQIDGRRYCESANRLSLAVPVLAEVFPDAQFIWMVRDGRDVVSSGVQRGWFDPDRAKDTPWERHRLRGDRLHDVSEDEWAQWPPFRRVCWTWRRTNEIIGSDLASLDPDRVMRLRLEDMADRMDDVAEFLDIAPMEWVVPRMNARAKRPDTGPETANQVDHRFGPEDWTEDQVAAFAEECGNLMDDWYPGWDRDDATADADTGGTEPAPDPAERLQVELADLRVLRGELNLLTSHTLRIDRRLVESRGANEKLAATNALLMEKMDARQENTRRVELRLADESTRSAMLKKELDAATRSLAEAKSEAAAVRRRQQLVENSTSFRVGHRLVRLATTPQRLSNALRRRGRVRTVVPAKSSAVDAPPVVTVSPEPEVGFADLDRLEAETIESGALRHFRMTLPSEEIAEDKVRAAMATLAPEGIGEIVLPGDSEPHRVSSVLGLITDSGRAVSIDAHAGRLVLRLEAEGSEPVPVAEVALLGAASATEELTRVRSELAKAEKSLAQERKTTNARLEKAHDSTQYRLGSALLDVVQNPAKVAKLPRELWHLQRRRTKPVPVGPSESASVPPALDLKVVSILDEFTHDCFAPEFELTPLDRTGWRAQLDGAGLVFVESAWRGNGGAWSYTLNKFEKNGEDLKEMLEAARSAGIPSVFWNKEDPVSFDVFLPATRAFDAVLTTDLDVVDDYKSALGHDRVAAMAFAAQPRLHNPIGRGRDVAGRVCFAGSWRGDKYAQRGSDFDILLGPPLERGALDIYDRYAGGPDAERLGFPDPFRSAVVGSLPYSEMGNAYRRYAAFLNVNSVQTSPTMFSRRVFELLACGTPVISTRAQGIDELLGDTVLVTESREQTGEYVDWVLNEPVARDRHSHLGYRLVHREHSYEQRVDAMLSMIGTPASRPRRRVSVICVSNRPEMLDHALDSYLRQTYTDTEFVFVANSASFDESVLASVESRVPGAKVLRIDEAATLGDCLNEALGVATGEYFAKFDDDDHYGDEYLADVMMTFPYTGAAVAGKQCYYAYLEGQDRTVLRFPGREFRDAPRVVGGTIVADRSQVGDIAFEAVPQGTDSRFLNAVRARGLTVFSADRFNFCQVRHANVASHTWAIEDDEFLKACAPVGAGFREDEIFL
ncbi:MAG: glycosyltransferase [Acidimicrobiales bacterium]